MGESSLIEPVINERIILKSLFSYDLYIINNPINKIKAHTISKYVANSAKSVSGSTVNRRLDVISSMFTTSKNNLMSLFGKKLGFNYNVMCDKINVDTPINPNTDRLLQMEDIEYEGISIGGNMFYRPDALGAMLLNLDGGEAGTLFDGDYTWLADDLRRIGKGEDIDELLNEKYDDDYCHVCDSSSEDCEC